MWKLRLGEAHEDREGDLREREEKITIAGGDLENGRDFPGRGRRR